MIGLTQRQQSILKTITHFVKTKEIPPSLAEIAKELSISAPTVLQHLRALEKKGYIQRSSNARSLRLMTKKTKEKAGIFQVSLFEMDKEEKQLELIGKYYLNPIHVIENYQQVFFSFRVSKPVCDFLEGDILLINREATTVENKWALVQKDDKIELKIADKSDQIIGYVVMMERLYE